MRPWIGITCDYDDTAQRSSLSATYERAIYQSGGIPLLLPITAEDCAEEILSRLDGLLLTGGGDVNPLLYGELPCCQLGTINPKRDNQEFALCRAAAEMEKPILGICRGIQVLNTAMGGTVYQDIASAAENTGPIKHSQQAPRYMASHPVEIEKSSLLEEIFGKRSLLVNSFHHQAVKKAAPGFSISAYAPDGFPEAIEKRENGIAIGVQWHPECMFDSDPDSARLFQYFVRLCQAEK